MKLRDSKTNKLQHADYNRQWRKDWLAAATPEELEVARKKSAAKTRRYRHAVETPGNRAKRLAKAKQQNREWRKREDHKQRAARFRRYRVRIRIKVLIHYGGKCICCGEDNFGFLTVAHKLANGNVDTRFFAAAGYRRAGTAMYLRIIKLDYPDDLTVLCWNCNTGAHHNGGTCPHLKPPPCQL